MKNHGNKKSKLDSVFNSSKLLQVHTGDQSVLPTPPPLPSQIFHHLSHAWALSTPWQTQCNEAMPWNPLSRGGHTQRSPSSALFHKTVARVVVVSFLDIEPH